MIRILVVDDELLAQAELKALISREKDVLVAGTAASGTEALEKIKGADIDALFLDIEMPGLSGIDVAGALIQMTNPPLVVFATAYDEYAVQAFEANAVDYILKPYDPARIERALARLRERLRVPAESREKLVSLEDYLIKQGKVKKVAGHYRNSKERVVINPANVLFFYAELSEVRAKLEDDELIVNGTLKELLQNLDAAKFAQTHKSHIVNLDKVEKVSPLFSGNYQLTLKDSRKTKIALSRRYAKNIKHLLANW